MKCVQGSVNGQNPGDYIFRWSAQTHHKPRVGKSVFQESFRSGGGFETFAKPERGDSERWGGC
jgi:hypothetical protein